MREDRMIRLMELTDRLLELEIPNAKAVKSALRKGSPSMSKDEWKSTFSRERGRIQNPVERVTKVAIRLPNQTTLTGSFLKGHIAVRDKIIKSNMSGFQSVTLRPTDPKLGFKTNLQPFVSRKEALQIARRGRKRLRPGSYLEGLHSSDMNDL